ncbi:MAG: hypothetical protein ACP5N7_06430 [Candidatus Pacearchaeota archaeon]
MTVANPDSSSASTERKGFHPLSKVIIYASLAGLIYVGGAGTVLKLVGDQKRSDTARALILGSDGPSMAIEPTNEGIRIVIDENDDDGIAILGGQYPVVACNGVGENGNIEIIIAPLAEGSTTLGSKALEALQQGLLEINVLDQDGGEIPIIGQIHASDLCD